MTDLEHECAILRAILRDLDWQTVDPGAGDPYRCGQ